MNQVLSKDILLAIKSDNLVLFAELIKTQKNISLGRFPLLSLSVLYNAKKIFRNYKDTLISLKEYEVIDEPREVYDMFRAEAGRALRLYADNDCVISVIEMLAIKNKIREVKKFYHTFSNDTIIKNKLKTIFNISTQKAEIETTSIKIGRRPWSSYQKRLRVCALCVAAAFICVLSCSFAFVGFVLGFGTPFNPFKVSSEGQLLMALRSDGYYVLTDNITLSRAVRGEFKGVLQGNGFTLYVDNLPSEGYLLENNGGVIENLKVQYPSQTIDTGRSLSLFVSNNLGTLKNISISCEDLAVIFNKSGEEEKYISALATTNNGVVEDSQVSWDVSLHATGDGECAVGGVVGANNGTINGCVSLDGEIETKEADIAGIACNNSKQAIIRNCKNYSVLRQSSVSVSWNPNVGGIAILNFGYIENSHNYGNLKVESLFDEETGGGSLYLGGISSNNCGTISKCLNNADKIESVSQRIVSYVGGITGYSYYQQIDNQTYLPIISGCGVNSIIDAYSENEKAFVFVGGISGYLFGQMDNCYSLAEFVRGNDEEKYLVGLAIGATDVQYSIFTGNMICISADKIYVLDVNNVLYQVASLINSNYQLTLGLDVTDAIYTTTLEQIIAQEVYWDAE